MVEQAQWTDEACVHAVAEGDMAGLEPLYRRHASRLKATARRMLGSEQAAEDTVQELFATVARRAATWDRRRGTVVSWLMIRVRSRCLDQLRRRSREVKVAERLRGVGAGSRPAEMFAEPALRAAVLQLPEAEREAIILRYAEGLTSQEAGAALSVPPGTIKSRTARALDRLSRTLRAQTTWDGASVTSSASGGCTSGGRTSLAA